MVGRHTGNPQMRSKRQTAWEAAAKCATLAKEADDPQEREHYARMRDAWITLCEQMRVLQCFRCDGFGAISCWPPAVRLNAG